MAPTSASTSTTPIRAPSTLRRLRASVRIWSAASKPMGRELDMRDLLLEIGSRPAARRLVGRLGLPLPRKLTRVRGAWEARPLADQNIVIGGVAGSQMAAVVARVVTAGGGYPVVASGDAEVFRDRKSTRLNSSH